MRKRNELERKNKKIIKHKDTYILIKRGASGQHKRLVLAVPHLSEADASISCNLYNIVLIQLFF